MTKKLRFKIDTTHDRPFCLYVRKWWGWKKIYSSDYKPSVYKRYEEVKSLPEYLA